MEEKTHERGFGTDGQTLLLLTKVVTKEVPPDVTACIYWLKNRCRDKWKDSHDKVELEQARLELDRRRLEADLKEKEGGDRTIMITLSPELEELAQ